MIEAEVFQGATLLMQRTYYEPNLTLAAAQALLEDYVRDEGVNTDGDCLIRVRFSGLYPLSRA